ncbi:hypothetical protein EV714DRAFT_277326 [Schizophyllum commune]
MSDAPEDDLPAKEHANGKDGAPSAVPRHPTFYLPDGNLVIQVEGCLYKVHNGFLQMVSGALNNILSMKTDETSGNDAHPLTLGPDTTRRMFDSYLKWSFRIDEDLLVRDARLLPENERRALLRDRETLCVDLLMFAHRWEDARIKTSAVQALETCDLRPVRRLQLARQFDIYDWVLPAVRRLIPSCINNISRGDIEAMHAVVFHIIACGREKYLEAQIARVYVAPSLEKDPPYDPAHKHKDCQTVWKQYWWNTIARRSLAPAMPLQEWDYAQTVGHQRAHLQAAGMHAHCIDYITEKLDKGTAYAHDNREGVIEAVAASIIKYFKGEM